MKFYVKIRSYSVLLKSYTIWENAMVTKKKNRGFKGKVVSEGKLKFIELGPKTKEVKAKSLDGPVRWNDDGPSDTTVRTQKSLRNLLKNQIKIENDYRVETGAVTQKLKEVDAVKEALFNWICEIRTDHIMEAAKVRFHFTGALGEADFDLSKIQLSPYLDYLTVLEERLPTKRLYSLEVTFHRTLKRSPAFKKDLRIVCSLITTYKVLQFRN